MKNALSEFRFVYATPLFVLMGCTFVPSDPNAAQAEPGINGDVQLTDGSATREGSATDLDTYLHSLTLEPPQGKALITSTCAPEACGEALPDPWLGELHCHYDFATETQTASEELVALGTDDDLWAGNLLRGIPARSGDLQSIPVARGSRMLSTTLRDGVQVQLEAPSNSTYQAALAHLLQGQHEATGSAVASHIHTTSLFSRESLSKALGVDVGLSFLNVLGADLGVEARSYVERRTARVAVSFVQSCYRVVSDAPSNRADFFGAGVGVKELAAQLGEDVPVYVRSVTYGRRVLAVFEDSSQADDESLSRYVSARFGADGVSVDSSSEMATEGHYTRFSALVLGDNRIFSNVDQLIAYLDEPADLGTAWPISYTLNYVSDDTPFVVAQTTEVVTRACEACGASDPSESVGEGLSGTVSHLGSLSDLDTDNWSTKTSLLLSSEDEDWYSFIGIDDSGVVDPQASLSTGVDGIELCLFVDCLSGTPDPHCLSGVPASVGTLVGCCSTSGDVQLDGATWSGLCLNATDTAAVSVRVMLPTPVAATCVPYSLSMHY